MLEEYPSLAEGVGLENRKGVTAAGVRIPLPPPLLKKIFDTLVSNFFYLNYDNSGN